MLREIICIDEEKCDGCGQCIPACHEGALELVHGKVRLVADKLCDGLGACLGECPQGALRVETRSAEGFDDAAVAMRLNELQRGMSPSNGSSRHVLDHVEAAGRHACPSQRFVQLEQQEDLSPRPIADIPSRLTHWPVQLRLLPPTAPVLQGASLLLTADCVPVALPDFHQKLLQGKAVAVACPKLDDARGHLEKLTEIIRRNELEGITVAHMEVPCCSGLLMMAVEARRLSGKSVPVVDVTIGTRGEVLARKEVYAEAPLRTRV
jgi:NAD-dependent dihydropyrimidine dehydrogenase PreA subunit